VIGRRAGRAGRPPLMVGSHLDTVEEGGRFDGIAGVLAGLEVARCLEAAGHRLRRALEIVDFTCEEPSDFGLSTIGSRAMSGKLDAAAVAGLRDARGRTLGFPTANLCTQNELLPPHGVYATMTTIGGVVHPSVTNIGTRPTVDDSGRQFIETHVFEFDGDLYGAAIRVGFVQRLRDERAFESLDLLKAQIAADCARARVLFGQLSL